MPMPRRKSIAIAAVLLLAAAAIAVWLLFFRGPDLATLRGHRGPVNDVTFAPDGNVLVSCATDGSIRVWDLQRNRGRQVWTGHGGPVYSIAISPSGSMVASTGEDKTIRLWDLQHGAQIGRLEPGGVMPCVAFSADGRHLAAGGARIIRFWDAATYQQGPDLTGHTGRVHCLSFTADGKWLVSGADDKTVRVWDAVTGKPTGRVLHLKGDVRSLAIAPDHATVAIASKGSAIRIWNLMTGEEAPSFPRVALTECIRFSPDGRFLVSAHEDGLVRVWTVADRVEIRSFKGHKGPVRAVAFAPDGKTLASGGSDETVKRWRLEK